MNKKYITIGVFSLALLLLATGSASAMSTWVNGDGQQGNGSMMRGQGWGEGRSMMQEYRDREDKDQGRPDDGFATSTPRMVGVPGMMRDLGEQGKFGISFLGSVTSIANNVLSVTGSGMMRRATTTAYVDVSTATVFSGMGRNAATSTVSSIISGDHVLVLGDVTGTTTIKAKYVYDLGTTTPGNFGGMMRPFGDRGNEPAQQGGFKGLISRMFSPFTRWFRR